MKVARILPAELSRVRSLMAVRVPFGYPEKILRAHVTDQGRVSQEGSGRGALVEVFSAFLKLGLTSFGGPVAHLACFRNELVLKRRWLSEEAYADLLTLCQFLPGPASSQVGFCLGFLRAGWTGALAAFLAFTLPSALLMLTFAAAAESLSGPLADAALKGLKISAAAIVAHAVWGMAHHHCPDPKRALIAVAAVAIIAFAPVSLGMPIAIVVGALCGLALGTKLTSSSGEELILGIPRFVGVASLMIFGLLLAMSPVLAGSSQAAAVFSGFFRAGSLVFGGGHVVLPLLESETVTRGWIGAEEFLAGYGAAQALPGPLFAFSAYLGFKLEPEPNELTGAVLAMSGLFLPGFLLVIGVLPFWDRLRSSLQAQSAMKGANASVVGILGAALYSPILTTAASDMREFALGLAGFAVLQAWKMPPLAVVICLVAARMALDPFV